MADHSSGNSSNDMEGHRNTYEGFLKGSIALAIICGFVMVALVNFRFAHTLNVFSGFAGLILGIISVGIGWSLGGKWIFPAALLVVFGLISAINVS